MERDRKVARMRKLRRIARELDGDEPAASAAARRYASMDESDREEIWGLRCTFVAMDRACGTSRKAAPGRPSISFRLEGGRLVREQAEVPANGGGGGVGESSSSVAAVAAAAAAVAGPEDELCSAFGSARV